MTRRGRYPVKAGCYANDLRPIEEGCACGACRRFSRSYVRHLLNVGEILGVRLLTLHNLQVYAAFMEAMRAAIAAGRFETFRRTVLSEYADVCEDHAETRGDGR